MSFLPNAPSFLRKEEPPAKFGMKLKNFLAAHWRGVFIIIVPLLLIPMLTPFPPQPYQYCAYTLSVMACYWVTECIPLPVTSFLPLLIFPLADVMDTAALCICYINDTILLFLGSIMLAGAVEQSGLHKRLALCAIRCIGYSHYKLLFAMCFITMFVSMWITNTAATTMMVPINFALLKVFEDLKLLKIYDKTSHGDIEASDMTTCYFCAATYSATIGGIGTLVGTATNLVFKELFHSQYKQAPEYLSFPLFTAFSFPYMLLMELCTYLYLIVVYFGWLRPKSKAAKAAHITPKGIEAAKAAVEDSWKKLGPLTFWEGIVAILFTGAMIMFFSRSPQLFTGWADVLVKFFEEKTPRYIRDSACAMLVCFIMMVLPSNLKIFKYCTAKNYEQLPKRISGTIMWREVNAGLPYSFMFLLGGGVALSTAAKPEFTDLNGQIGTFLRKLKDLPNLLIVFIIILLTVVITNFASNVAVCNVITPIAMTLAKEINQNPLLYNLASGYSASYCYCLPVGTPGNLVVQGAAHIPTRKMIVAGVGSTVSGILLTWLAMSFWAPVIWPDIKKMPAWITA